MARPALCDMRRTERVDSLVELIKIHPEMPPRPVR
jgi:hypothetical protein